jgi:hypothetical protein
MAEEHTRRFNLLVMYRAGKSFTFDPGHLSSHEGSLGGAWCGRGPPSTTGYLINDPSSCHEIPVFPFRHSFKRLALPRSGPKAQKRRRDEDAKASPARPSQWCHLQLESDTLSPSARNQQFLKLPPISLPILRVPHHLMVLPPWACCDTNQPIENTRPHYPTARCLGR